MVEEVFDDGEELTPEQKVAFKALMFGTGVLKISQTKDGKVEFGHIPIYDMAQPPKDTQ